MPLTTPLKKSHFFQKNKQNICLKNKQTNKIKWLLENRILILTPNPIWHVFSCKNNMDWKGFFQHNIIKKEKSLNQKWDEIMIVIFQEIKTEKEKTKQIKQKQIDEELFFSVCACCVLTKFFFESSYSLLGFMLLN